MFKDIQLSKDIENDFKKSKNNSAIDGVEFGVEILTNGNWPIETRPTCSIPAPLKKCITDFEMFYKNKHQNRNISWLYNNGQAEILTTFTAKKFQVICNVFQASVLSLYNDEDVLTYKELLERTNIQEEYMKPALIQLCNPKVRILDKAVKKPTFDDPDEKIKINLKFNSNNIRVNVVPQASAKKKTNEKDKDELANDAAVKTERQVIIQATSVKILKTRKTIAYQELITENLGMITMFKAQPAMIKEQIEVLIQRGYMERDPKNKKMLIYLP